MIWKPNVLTTTKRGDCLRGNLDFHVVVYSPVCRANICSASRGRVLRVDRKHGLRGELPGGEVRNFSGRSCCCAASYGNQSACAHRTQEEKGSWDYWCVMLPPPRNNSIMFVVTNVQFQFFVVNLPLFFFFFLGYILAILMMAVIIVLGVGITLGYFYKRLVSDFTDSHIVSLLLKLSHWNSRNTFKLDINNSCIK